MLRKNKSSRSPLSESTAPAITLDAALPGILPDRTATASPHLLAPAGPSNWRRWLRPGKLSTAPADTLAYPREREEARAQAARKSKDSSRPSVENQPPTGGFSLLKKSPSTQPLGSFATEASGIKPSGSRLFGRRSTVTAGAEDPSISPSKSRHAVPPMPAPSAWNPGADFDDEPARRPSGDLVRSGLAGMSKKPWSRSVDDFSRILGMGKKVKPDLHPGALAAGYYGGDLEVTINSGEASAPGSARGTSDIVTPTSATSSSHQVLPAPQAERVNSQENVKPRQQSHSSQRPPFEVERVETIQLAFPSSAEPAGNDELHTRRGPRRKTHSLSGTALLDGTPGPDGSSALPTARSHGLLRGPGKASSPPAVHTSFLALQGNSSLKTSESSPMLSGGADLRSHPFDRLAKLKSEGQPSSLRDEREGGPSSSTSGKHDDTGHHRASSQSLLPLGLMNKKHDRKKGSEGSQSVLRLNQGSLQPSGSVASLSRLAGKLPQPAEHHDQHHGESRPTHAKRASQIVHCSGFLLRHTSTVEQTAKASPSGQPGPPDYFNLTKRVDLQRGWRPYKAQLKGTKIFLYKPPNDKKHAIEGLFPQSARSSTPEPASPALAAAAIDRRPGRPKRAYLNCARHPELAINSALPPGSSVRDRLQGGSVSALVHELIFTTLGHPLVETETSSAPQATEYRHFAQAVLVAILTSDSASEVFANLRTYHDLALTSYPEQRHILDLRIAVLLDILQRGFLTACGAEGVLQEDCARWLAWMSENSLSAGTLRSQAALEHAVSARPTLPVGRRASVDVLRLIEGTTVETVSRTLRAHHAGALQYLQHDIAQAVADAALGVSGSPASACLRAIAFGPSLSSFLTRTALRHIISESSPAGPGADFQQAIATTLSLWIDIGESCRQLKDTPGLVAIWLALTAPPVARLANCWDLVPQQRKVLLAQWTALISPHRSFPGEEMRLSAFSLDGPNAVPYLGDLASTLSKHTVKRNNGDFVSLTGWWPTADAAFSCDFESLGDDVLPVSRGISEAVLQSFWRESLLSATASTGWETLWRKSLILDPPPNHTCWRPIVTAAQDLAALRFVNIMPPAASPGDDSPATEVAVRRKSQPISRRSSVAGTSVSRRTSQSANKRQSDDLTSQTGSSETVELAEGELVVRLRMPANRASRPFKAESDQLSANLWRQSWHADQSMVSTNLAQAHRLSVISKRTSIASSKDLPPLGMVVESGSLDRLIDVMLCGLQLRCGSVDDHGMQPMKEGGRKFELNLADFTDTFLTTYRLICQPVVLLELLRKRFDRANHAFSRGPGAVSQLSFQWLADGASPAQPGQAVNPDIRDFLQRRVLDVLETWMLRPGTAREFLSSPELYGAVLSVLTSTETIDKLVRTRQSEVLGSLLVLQDAPVGTASAVAASGDLAAQTFGWQIPGADSGQHILDNLDALGHQLIASFGSQTWIDAVIAMAKQGSVGWHEKDPSFLLRRRQTGATSVQVDDIYTWLSRPLAPEPGSGGDNEAFWKKLPSGIQVCFEAFAVCRQWLEDWIETGPNKAVALKSLLDALAKACGKNPDSQKLGGVSSFASRVLQAVLISPVSRSATNAWMTILRERGLGLDASLADLVGDVLMQRSAPLAPDVGYLLEQTIQALSVPSDALSGVPITRLSALLSPLADARLEAKSPAKGPLLKEVLSRYSSETLRSIGKSPSPRSPGEQLPMFKNLLHAEAVKIDRDYRALCQFMVKQNHSAASISRRDQQLNRLLAAPRPEPKQPNRPPKRGVTAVIKSLYSWPSSSVQSLALQDARTAEELDFEPSSKAQMVIALPLAQQLVSNQRPYTFTLTTEDGVVHIMQAMTEASHVNWVTAVNQATAAALETRRNFLSTPPIVEHVETAQMTPMRRSAHAVFGVDLSTLARRHYGIEALDDTAIPPQIEQCFAEVERRGLVEQGIYRVPGSSRVVRQLQDAFDQGLEVDLGPDGDYADIHVVCGVIKSFFRLMPEPIMPTAMYQQLIGAVQLSDTDQRLAAVKDFIWQLPRAHFALLKRLMEHLEQCTDFEEQTQMPPQSLAMCFAPNLLRPPTDQGGFNAALINIGKATKLVKLLITEYHWIFLDNFVHSAPPSPMLMDEPGSSAQSGHFAHPSG